MRTHSPLDPIGGYFQEMQNVLAEVPREAIQAVISALYVAWAQRKQVFVVGNGGSASTASHIANDLSKATIVPGMPRMRVIALTDNVAVMTAWGNDVSYDCIFKEQLENLLQAGDVVLGISASGNSPNVLRAMEFARQLGAVTIGWTGQAGGHLKDIVDHCAHAPTEDVGMIESVHLVLVHLVTKQIASCIRADSLKQPADRIVSGLSTAGIAAI
jgi:D-sedoheptulose 7-phosphate isomerase